MAQLSEAELAKMRDELTARFDPHLLGIVGVYDFVMRMTLNRAQQLGWQEIANRQLLTLAHLLGSIVVRDGHGTEEDFMAALSALDGINATARYIASIPE